MEAVRSSQQQARFRQTFSPLLPATYLSAVVAYELAVDAGDRRTRGLVRDFVRPMVATRRVIAPAFEDWQQAAGIVTIIGDRDRGWRSKLPTLVNDILIALCARRIGAVLFTYNAADFRLIHRHADFELRVLR